MKKIIKNIAIVVVAYLIGCGIGLIIVLGINARARVGDTYAMNRITQLRGNNIACTGTLVIAPSGKPLTITAAHCQKLVIDNKIGYTDQVGAEGTVSVIAIDERLDLMLLEGTHSNVGFEVAKQVKIADAVHTMTHGWTMPAYRTDGAVVSTTLRPDEPKCDQYINLGGTNMGVNCQLSPARIVTSAWALPGSSGGPLLNTNNDLIGIVYATSGPFSYSVGLDDIKAFLKGH